MRGRLRAALTSLLLLAALWGAWRALRSEPPLPAPVVSPSPAPSVPVESASSGADPTPTPSRAMSAPSEPEAEAETNLRELERLSLTDKPRALALAREADAKLPSHGVMAEARRALIVTLLVDSNQWREARERTRDFASRYPTSRYLPLVQGVTGVHPRPRPSELRDARR